MLTGQMQGDLKVIGLPDGYGIGYSNDHNYDKSQWLEQTYKKDIWSLTAQEEKRIEDVADAYTDKIMEGA
ncbi:MAG: hypothetical protein INR73_20375 [Williamsia sp.]|nr:hypothetical protein [Williamsia sp.]